MPSLGLVTVTMLEGELGSLVELFEGSLELRSFWNEEERPRPECKFRTQQHERTV